MAISEEQLRYAVDEVLEPSWPRERRRALRRLRCSTAGRIVVFLAVLGMLDFIVYAMTGVTLPWTFFAFMAPFITVLAVREAAREGSHLRRD